MLTASRPPAKQPPPMASNTRETWKRRLRRKAKAGRKRKNQESRHSTPSAAELFAGMGKPGEPARTK
jgi:hypothetical protein